MTGDENPGGVGGDVLMSCLFTNPLQLSPDMRLVERAIKEGWVSLWKITPERKAAIMSRLDTMLENCTEDKEAAWIAELQRKMAADDVKALVEIVKLIRLQAGKSTENVEHDVRTRIIVERRDVPDPDAGKEGPRTDAPNDRGDG